MIDRQEGTAIAGRLLTPPPITPTRNLPSQPLMDHHLNANLHDHPSPPPIHRASVGWLLCSGLSPCQHPFPVPVHLQFDFLWRLHTHHTSPHQFKLHKWPPLLPREAVVLIDTDSNCINVKKLLCIQFNVALTEPKMRMPTKKDSPKSFVFIIKPYLVLAEASRRLSYSCTDIWNQLGKVASWS